VRCSDARELIEARIDGVLDAVRERELRSHLASCPECRHAHAVLSAIDSALDEVSVSQAPPWLVGSTMSAIARRESSRETLERVLLWAAGLTAGGFGVASVIRAVRIATVGTALTEAASRTAAAFPQPAVPNVETPGLLQQLAESPSVAGVLWALAIVGAAFLAIQFLRTSRQLALELR